MTRRPIFIAGATVLALALTAGLAYGAGRIVGTHGRSNLGGRQGQYGMMGTAPGYFFGQNTQARFRHGMGSPRGWMGGRSGSRGWSQRPSFMGNGRFPQAGYQTGGGPGTANGGYQGFRYGNHPSGHPYDGHHMGSGGWGSGSGSRGGCCGWF